MDSTRLFRAATFCAALGAAGGGAAAFADGHTLGWAFFAAGSVMLGARLAALAVEAPGRWDAALRWLPVLAGLAFLAAALGGALPMVWPPRETLATAGLGVQALLGGVVGDLRGRFPNPVVAVAGHLACAGAAVLAFAGPAEWGTRILTLYAAGFACLALRAHWAFAVRAGRRAGTVELPFLAALLAALACVVANHLAWLRADGPAIGSWALGAGAAAALAMALLPGPPVLLRPAKPPDLVPAMAAHGAMLIALPNAFLLAIGFAYPWAAVGPLLLVAVWQVVFVSIEYGSLAVSHRWLRRARGPPPEVPAEPLVCVVAAHNEGSVLEATLEANLAVDWPLRFLLVPSMSSDDDTVAIAQRLAAAHPERVRVVPGTTGSKAEDLNLAWRHVDTPVALILDADETIDAPSLAWGLAALRDHPGAGVVQGRKAARHVNGSLLGRFIAMERRHSTALDQAMQAEALDSGHFAGSGALLRREVPDAVGGWTTATLTEDIEFTLRMRLRTRWGLVYEPRMVVRESIPRGLAALVRQRTRWARGWARCCFLYLGPVLAASPRLGPRATFGYVTTLLTTVSALWSTFFIALFVLREAAVLVLPVLAALVLASLVLPARIVGLTWVALRDPVIPVRRRPGPLVELVFHAAGWIVLGWFVQLHALYLEASGTPAIWEVTAKGPAPTRQRGPAGRAQA